MVTYAFLASRSLYRAVTTRGARVAVSTPVPVSAHRNYSSTMHGNDPEVLEREKQRNLSKSQHLTSTPHEHAPGWNEVLASESEASIKADKSPLSNADLQAKTVEYIRSRHSDDSVETKNAAYAREEVIGPLSGAKGKEDASAGINDQDAHSIQKPVASTVDASTAGGSSAVRETVTEDVIEVHKKGEVVKEVPGENPTPSEEAVRADQGKEIVS
ncbi:hypothetical protein M378DRAFT_159514 [Amanita muscaria Koide BX008]|uniref:Uncharacterized protein n=1 Tax=Amanita muscaria (strain Koide BX008) TaxID=946122 RepID=A0A0C2TKU7_AMAMK|nr:hypothetical protein M378DRAFT_159514 [Amanita muscaria Koide BX008]